MVVSGAHHSQFEQSAEPFIRRARARPRIAGVRIMVRAARKFPPYRAAGTYRGGPVHPPFMAKRLMRLDMLVVGPEIIGVNPGLHDFILLQSLDGFGRPSRFAKPDIAVAPAQVLPIGKFARDVPHAEIDQAFLIPQQGFGANADMVDTRLIGQFERRSPYWHSTTVT